MFPTFIVFPLFLSLCLLISMMLQGLFPAAADVVLHWVMPLIPVVFPPAVLVWVAFLVRAMLREHERTQAERIARDELLKEQNYEWWAAQQTHASQVQARAQDVLARLQARPLRERLAACVRLEETAP